MWQIATALGLAVNMVNDAFIYYHNFENVEMTYHDFGEGFWDCMVGQHYAQEQGDDGYFQ